MSIAIQGSYSDQYSAHGVTLAAGGSNALARKPAEGGQATAVASGAGANGAKAVASKAPAPPSVADPRELTAEEKAEVSRLKERDTEVRVHEQAHVAAGSQYVRGGANLEYTTGPDGRKYAVGGEVSIDTSPVADDPRATILKMATIKRAALAPAQPSSKDRSVAATAERTAMEARQALAAKALEEQQALVGGSRPAKGTLFAVTV